MSDPTLNHHDFSGIDSLGFRQYPVYPLTYVYNPSLHQGHSVYYPYGFVLPFSQIGGFGLGHAHGSHVIVGGSHGFAGGFHRFAGNHFNRQS